mmetsp:Transcript_7480/g.13939  ORF Transcript_7480/g.13939 Transcript_7480/m.13939 type:complete len:379 (+) Transcript_7480:58-1194(+)
MSGRKLFGFEVLLVLSLLRCGEGISSMAPSSLSECMLDFQDRDHFSPKFPEFSRCKNKACFRNKYEGSDDSGSYVPINFNNDQVDAAHALSTIAFSDLPKTPLSEFLCDGTYENELEAIRALKDSIAHSEPIVLRKCARELPAVEKWDKQYLSLKLPELEKVFSKQEFFDSSIEVPSELHDDLEKDTRFLSFLKDFKHTHMAWISPGGKIASAHMDTADNVHVMVKGEKTFFLASPKYARNMYVDFQGENCPGQAYGCDGHGCYAYSGFNSESINILQYPAVLDIELNTTTLFEGDVLVIPSFWFHNVWHLPLDSTGFNIAVSFIHQRDTKDQYEKSMLPSAEDIIRYWKLYSEGYGSEYLERLEEAGGTSPPAGDEL